MRNAAELCKAAAAGGWLQCNSRINYLFPDRKYFKSNSQAKFSFQFCRLICSKDKAIADSFLFAKEFIESLCKAPLKLQQKDADSQLQCGLEPDYFENICRFFYENIFTHSNFTHRLSRRFWLVIARESSTETSRMKTFWWTSRRSS